MLSPRARAPWLVAVLVFLLPYSWAGDEDGEASKATSGLVALAKFIPLGQVQKAVVFPSYSGTKIESLIKAVSMERIDDEHLFLKEMVITYFDEEEKEEMVVTMPVATYNLIDGSLKSSGRSFVTREDFDIEGDSLLFSGDGQFGRMDGNVKMTIKDSSSLGLSEEDEQPPVTNDQETSP